MRSWTRFGPILGIAALSGCVALDAGPIALVGSWGGPHIGLELDGGLGAVQFECATGTIDQPIVSGRPFSIQGTYRPGQIGPVRVGQVFTEKRATYSGTATKTDINMTVKVEDGEVLGPFDLKLGTPAQIAQCTDQLNR
ncbi:MAG TPA: hypothetical protein VGE68_02275 [Sphingomicrobium sp.]